MNTQLEVITVSNGTNKYFGNFTKEENKIIEENLIGRSLHLFSGKSQIGNIKVDFSCKEANFNMDVFDYLENRFLDFNTVILDPPYNLKFAEKYQKYGDTPNQFIIFANAKKTTYLFQLIEEKIKHERIILKSWNYYIPKYYDLEKGFLCYAGGYRKPTILLILNRKE